MDDEEDRAADAALERRGIDPELAKAASRG
jgi:hypothetical protein